MSQPKPTDLKNPSGRDTIIFYECRVLKRTQEEVAQQFELSQARVSQIVKRVSQWRADASPAEGGELERDQSRRLTHWEGKQRIEKFLGWTMAGIVDSQRSQTIVKQREDGEGQVQWKETTVKPPVVSATFCGKRGSTTINCSPTTTGRRRLPRRGTCRSRCRKKCRRRSPGCCRSSGEFIPPSMPMSARLSTTDRRG